MTNNFVQRCQSIYVYNLSCTHTLTHTVWRSVRLCAHDWLSWSTDVSSVSEEFSTSRASQHSHTHTHTHTQHFSILSAPTHLSLSLSLSLYLSINLHYLHRSINQSIKSLYLHRSINQSIYLSTSLSIYLSLHCRYGSGFYLQARIQLTDPPPDMETRTGSFLSRRSFRRQTSGQSGPRSPTQTSSGHQFNDPERSVVGYRVECAFAGVV